MIIETAGTPKPTPGPYLSSRIGQNHIETAAPTLIEK